jgi:hypothetical protein
MIACCVRSSGTLPRLLDVELDDSDEVIEPMFMLRAEAAVRLSNRVARLPDGCLCDWFLAAAFGRCDGIAGGAIAGWMPESVLFGEASRFRVGGRSSDNLAGKDIQRF